MLRFGFEDEFLQVRHPLWVENAVEVIEFMLNDAGVEPARRALDRLAAVIHAAIPDMGRPLDIAAHAGDREAAFPPTLHLRLIARNMYSACSQSSTVSRDAISISGLMRTVSGAV